MNPSSDWSMTLRPGDSTQLNEAQTGSFLDQAITLGSTPQAKAALDFLKRILSPATVSFDGQEIHVVGPDPKYRFTMRVPTRLDPGPQLPRGFTITEE